MPADDQPRVYAIAMRQRFRGITERQGVLWRGRAGWTEWSPFLDYDDATAAAWLAAADEAAEQGFPAPVRDRVPVNCTVPAVDPATAHRLVAASGCRTAKVKVAEPGQRLDDDRERVAAVRDALGAAGRVRVDANGGWDVDTAVEALTALDRWDLEYAEQPCPRVEDLAALRVRLAGKGRSVPVAADESIRRAADPYRVAELEAADVAVLKVQPLGGVRACLEIAERIGLPVVVSSALETGVGLAAGLALAAALPELPYACGLNTGPLLTDDPVAAPLRAVDGVMPVPTQDALVLDEAAWSRCAAGVRTAEGWAERLARVRGVLGARDTEGPRDGGAR
ncbi:O-succinylbenzoate synthase [Friedmanniella endophytica]|uniref:o-succinylbenzoate synthase n=1 Tax=Microlunatus kandeliicorticis TaxID=1759536 RepID=A0A7W3P4B7_9ACTN|nr:o-succinylbenzoate synthase [Microlunatus kandeliicorticis]MBA8792764.1 O-succinylbenzoate synthase [Microlunatus kandeliicorticis]